MKATRYLSIIGGTLLITSLTWATDRKGSAGKVSNSSIDYAAFAKLAQDLEGYRAKRRLSEELFLQCSKLPNTIILDTRSAAKFAQIHVAGAKHLNFSDITEKSLAKVIPNKDTRVLIYCNNNFEGEPVNFASKMRPAALNIPTFITLYIYGYRNIYELGPLLDMQTTKIPFEGRAANRKLAIASK